MTVLFITTSQFSIGELHNAICLARQLEENGTDTFFLTSANHVNYAKNSKVKARALSNKIKQTKVIKEVVEEKQVQAIIIADYYNLDFESPLIDLDFVVELGIPMATIDSLSFGPEEKVLRNQLFKGSKSRARNKFETYLRAIPENLKIIRTCPINNPHIMTERIFPVTLYTKSFELEAEEKQQVKKQFGCMNENDKLVMVSKSAWANLLVKMRLMETGTHMKVAYNYEYFLQELITEYIGEEDPESKVYVIGVAPEQGFITVDSDAKVQFISLPFLDLDEYEKVLFSCDLFITDNITSASMAKAMFAHVPVLTLMNSKVKASEDGEIEIPAEWENNRLREIINKWLGVMDNGIYPFLTYPNGWVSELQPLLKDNPWVDAIDTTEIFDMKETGKIIHNMLYCEETKQKINQKQAAYIQEIIKINKAEQMLDFILENKKTMKREGIK